MIYYNIQGMVPLICAATNGHLDIVMMVIDFGAEINRQDKVFFNLIIIIH